MSGIRPQSDYICKLVDSFLCVGTAEIDENVEGLHASGGVSLADLHLPD